MRRRVVEKHRRAEGGETATPSVVAHKLRTPRAPRLLIPRARAREQLDALRTAHLAWVHAPLGFGKTLAVLDWSRASGSTTRWLTIDIADNDAARLRTHLDEVLRHAEPGDVVVLDGVDAIIDARAQTTLCQAVSARPALRLVLLTRSNDLPVGLGPFARSGSVLGARVAEVTVEHLRFDEQDARGLLAAVLGSRPDEQHVRAFVARTEGWAAGLHLAGLALRDGHASPSSIAGPSGADPLIADLFGEVLEPAAEELVSFLLDTSVLDVLGVRSCEAITRRAGALAHLREAERCGMFVTRVNGERDAYRLHGMFREALEAELRRHDRARWREQHRRAGDASRATGDLTAAVRHFMAAGDRGRAWDVSCTHARSWFFDGKGGAVAQWTDVLASDTVTPSADETAELAFMMLLLGDATRAAAWLRRAERALGDPARVASPVAAPYSFARHLHALANGDLDEAWRRLAAAKQVFNRWAPGEWSRLRAPLAEVRLLSLLGEHANARRCYEQFETEHAQRSVTDRVLFPATLASVALAEGELNEAVRLADRALRMASWRDRRHPLLEGEARYVRGAVLLEQQRLDEAEAELDESISLAERSGFLPSWVLPSVQRALLLHARQRTQEARVALDDIRSHVRGAHRSLLAARIDVATARLALFDGDLDTAARAISRLYGDVPVMLGALVHAAAGRRADALAALERADTTRGWAHMRSLLIRACCATGDERLAFVHQALRFGEMHGYRRVFLEQRTWLTPTLAHVAASWPSPYATQVLELMPGPAVPHTRERGSEMLSEREREVLRYLATPLSMREIAQLLYVSRNTLKTHTRSIYRKLGVSNRAGAVARHRGAHGDAGDGSRVP